MKKLLPFLVLLIICSSALAQADKQNIKVVTDTEPSYPAGDNALYAYIFSNVKYSEEAKKKYVQGEVTVSFDVKTDSTVTNVVVISGAGYGIDEEVKRLVTALKFSPAIQNGTRVKMNTMYTFPVKAH